tara:strand:+ start:354 stop:590 length:237 start_codon:yes stop_codon:yes gene_type:complete
MDTLSDPKEFWTIEFLKDGLKRKAVVYEAKLMDALSVFNTQEATSGFNTPITMTYSYGVNGRAYIFELDGRYGVPRRI